MNMVELYGKSLPVLCYLGYLRRFEDMHGRGSTQAFIQSAAGAFFDRREERDAWLAPVYAYWGLRPQARQPLDYVYVALLEQGLRNAYSSNNQLVMRFTREVGKRWWYGTPPADTWMDYTSLSTVFAPAVLDNLNMLKHLFRRKKNNWIPEKKLIMAGVALFLRSLSSVNGISYGVFQKFARTVIIINECPFCLNQSPLCRVSFGIIEGCLEWLHGGNQPYAMRTQLQIRETESASHMIVLGPPSEEESG
jgi:hypothetical protein